MATMAKVTCTRPGCGLACSSPSVDEVMAWSEAHDQHCPSLQAQGIAPRLLAEAEKRGAVKALRAFARTFREYHEPTSHVLAGKVGSDLADRAHLIEHGEVDLAADRIESGEVTP